MSEKIINIAEMDLHGTKSGKISVYVVEQPYGPKSESVASIGISLKKEADKPDWKVHIPKANIDAVTEALQKAKEQL